MVLICVKDHNVRILPDGPVDHLVNFFKRGPDQKSSTITGRPPFLLEKNFTFTGDPGSYIFLILSFYISFFFTILNTFGLVLG